MEAARLSGVVASAENDLWHESTVECGAYVTVSGIFACTITNEVGKGILRKVKKIVVFLRSWLLPLLVMPPPFSVLIWQHIHITTQWKARRESVR